MRGHDRCCDYPQEIEGHGNPEADNSIPSQRPGLEDVDAKGEANSHRTPELEVCKPAREDRLGTRIAQCHDRERNHLEHASAHNSEKWQPGQVVEGLHARSVLWTKRRDKPECAGVDEFDDDTALGSDPAPH